MATAGTRESNPFSLATLILGILAFLVYFVGGFTLNLWPIGLLLSVITVLTWVAAKVKGRTDRSATIGLILAMVPLLWFAVFIILDAVGVISIE